MPSGSLAAICTFTLSPATFVCVPGLAIASAVVSVCVTFQLKVWLLL